MSEVKTDSVVNVSGDNDSGIDLSTNDVVAIKTANSEQVRVDADGHVGINNTTPGSYLEGELVVGNSTKDQYVNVVTGSGNAAGLCFQDQTGTSIVGGLRYTHSDNALQSWTNGSERMRINSSGHLLVGKTATGDATAGFEAQAGGRTTICRSGSQPLNVSRIGSDGTLVAFLAQGTEEGNITVSGTTVSYNGGHLSRWSQATDGNRIDGLVKGTVMTNLDQMAEWTKDGVTEDNEQLNCMAVSSVEGDANVAGVFVNWDDDDTDFTADMNIAMTGDMVIRIASGTTVARGDLLMSAGDGTAKPQGDDIVRSKTIAKVTSTTVSHTYDDGSYLVPCVLMAC
nr:hypothetical protein 37 [Alphaproteobacteria bacterium]